LIWVKKKIHGATNIIDPESVEPQEPIDSIVEEIEFTPTENGTYVPVE
jgi:hypothetical protein